MQKILYGTIFEGNITKFEGVIMRYLLLLMLLMSPVFAATIHVKAMEDFSTENPTKSFSIKLLEDLPAGNEAFKAGDILDGKIVDVVNPKRLKRNAAFSFVPLSVKNTEGEIFDIKGYYPAKYTTKLNKGEMVKSAALGVGNYFVKGVSMGYRAVEGAVKNEKDNRFKSSVNEVYESTPFSYVEKGEPIILEKNDIFLMNFKVENLPNYEYEQLD